MEEMKNWKSGKIQTGKKMEKLNVIFYSIILLMCAYSSSVARTRMWHQQQQNPT